MKRIFIMVTATAFCLLSTACGASPSTDSSASPSVPESSISSTPTDSDTLGDVMTGLGFVSTTSESSSANNETAGIAKFSVVACALCVDSEGKIWDVSFDTLQADVGFDTSGALTGDVASELKTKKELGDAYNMKASSEIGKEWYEQIAALENWMRGKTVEDVLAMKVYERDAEHKDVPDEEDLKTSVTISITDQLRALEKAYTNAK